MIPATVDPRTGEGRSNMIGTAGGAVVAAYVYKKAPGGPAVRIAIAAVSGLVAMGVLKNTI